MDDKEPQLFNNYKKIQERKRKEKENGMGNLG